MMMISIVLYLDRAALSQHAMGRRRLSFPETDELSVMTRNPVNGCHGFVLHDACWHLLQRAFQPSEILLKRLLKVCESLPIPHRGNGKC